MFYLSLFLSSISSEFIISISGSINWSSMSGCEKLKIEHLLTSIDFCFLYVDGLARSYWYFSNLDTIILDEWGLYDTDESDNLLKFDGFKSAIIDSEFGFLYSYLLFFTSVLILFEFLLFLLILLNPLSFYNYDWLFKSWNFEIFVILLCGLYSWFRKLVLNSIDCLSNCKSTLLKFACEKDWWLLWLLS